MKQFIQAVGTSGVVTISCVSAVVLGLLTGLVWPVVPLVMIGVAGLGLCLFMWFFSGSGAPRSSQRQSSLGLASGLLGGVSGGTGGGARNDRQDKRQAATPNSAQTWLIIIIGGIVLLWFLASGRD